VKSKKPNWDVITGDIVDRLVANGYYFQKKAKSVAGGSGGSVAGGSVARRSSSCTVSDTSSVKQVKLSDDDKEKIKTMYSTLDKSNMWKLSTGTLVEEQMMKHAIIQDYEQ